MTVSLSTHVLDTGAGRPAAGVRVEVWDVGSREGGARSVVEASTDSDGRIADLAVDLPPGDYVIAFHPPSPFFRRVALELRLEDGHYHVPLLISDYGCASYRGS